MTDKAEQADDESQQPVSERPESVEPASEAPWPGSKKMPRWDTGQLGDAPSLTRRNLLSMIGPGLVMGASAIGGGEWLLGPTVTAKYGGALLWLAAISILAQGLYNIEISRYTLYCGEPIFTGKFRTLPGPLFWVFVYLLLDFGSVFPYLAANAATPAATVLLGGQIPDPVQHIVLLRGTSVAIFLLAMVPLFFGGKVYNSLKMVMSCKLVLVIGFLLFLAVFYSHSRTWLEIGSGFFKIGTVPVQHGEDWNGNGRLDEGEDWDGDGNLDVVEQKLPPSIDTNGDGKADDWQKDAAGKPIKHVDVDGDGYYDGDNVENVFVSLFTRGELPKVNFQLIALICALAAIAGNGGLTNTPISNMTRDQGWGMGHEVGAIPSMVGGRGITLSHVGCVFLITKKTLAQWRRWYRHILRDQLCVWVPACFIGIALPSMLSVEFMRRGTDAEKWHTAVLTAGGVGESVAHPPSDVWASTTGLSNIISGSMWGNLFWALTLLCGFMVLTTSMVATIDGVLRRWVDVFWTASGRLRKLDTSFIKYVYFRVLLVYGAIGVTLLCFSQPQQLVEISTLIYNFALGFSCWHTLAVNTYLLPRELRPNWFIRICLVFCGTFFVLLGVVASYQKLHLDWGWI